MTAWSWYTCAGFLGDIVREWGRVRVKESDRAARDRPREEPLPTK